MSPLPRRMRRAASRRVAALTLQFADGVGVTVVPDFRIVTGPTEISGPSRRRAPASAPRGVPRPISGGGA